ncbi:hypothetical protein KI387_011139, partial [Taxus chinensis]
SLVECEEFKVKKNVDHNPEVPIHKVGDVEDISTKLHSARKVNKLRIDKLWICCFPLSHFRGVVIMDNIVEMVI